MCKFRYASLLKELNSDYIVNKSKLMEFPKLLFDSFCVFIADAFMPTVLVNTTHVEKIVVFAIVQGWITETWHPGVKSDKP